MLKIELLFRILQKQKLKIMKQKDFLILQIINKTKLDARSLYFYVKELNELSIQKLLNIKNQLSHES
jgi:hypothetical protein